MAESISRGRLRWPLLLTLSFAAALLPSLAAAGEDDDLPTPEELERRGAVIGSVVLDMHDIFDPTIPEEDRMLFRGANRLHRQTRPHVVEELLLFRPGDLYSARKIAESERLLRSTHFFDDPEIRVVRFADGRVDLRVTTRDLWTLKGGVGIGRSGGVNSTHFQLEDTNLLGTGRTVDLEQSSNVDRSSFLVHFRDANLAGRRVYLDVNYAENSDGNDRSFELTRPFFALDSRWAAGVRAATSDRVDSLYTLGHVSSSFRHREERFEIFQGIGRRSLGDADAAGAEQRVSRFTFGYTFERDRFEAPPGPGQTPPDELPGDRVLSEPWVAFDSVGDDYLKTHNFEQLGRVEDLSLGWRFHARLGASLETLGADRNEAVFDSTASWGRHPDSETSQTWLFSGAFSGRLGGEEGRNLLASTRARYYRRNFGEQLLLVSLEADAAHRLDPENQLLLGGDSGLRGYPLRYQQGDRRLLFSVEQRVFTNWYPFRLVRVGGAVFFDAGQMWSSDESFESQSRGLLKDIGIGLRLGSTRSSLGSVVHLDVAFPLDGDGTIRNVQFLVSSRTGF
ncbi:MAG: BamA/TamA family outer membrane protein [Thermoanaerobaculia bacterium]